MFVLFFCFTVIAVHPLINSQTFYLLFLTPLYSPLPHSALRAPRTCWKGWCTPSLTFMACAPLEPWRPPLLARRFSAWRHLPRSRRPPPAVHASTPALARSAESARGGTRCTPSTRPSAWLLPPRRWAAPRLSWAMHPTLALSRYPEYYPVTTIVHPTVSLAMFLTPKELFFIVLVMLLCCYLKMSFWLIKHYLEGFYVLWVLSTMSYFTRPSGRRQILVILGSTI